MKAITISLTDATGRGGKSSTSSSTTNKDKKFQKLSNFTSGVAKGLGISTNVDKTNKLTAASSSVKIGTDILSSVWSVAGTALNARANTLAATDQLVEAQKTRNLGQSVGTVLGLIGGATATGFLIGTAIGGWAMGAGTIIGTIVGAVVGLVAGIANEIIMAFNRKEIYRLEVAEDNLVTQFYGERLGVVSTAGNRNYR